MPVRMSVAAIGLVAAMWTLPAPREAAAPPPSLAPIPSGRQLASEDLEFYGFLHFGMNTFTDKEWGDGSEDERAFNPDALDARQWARIAHDAGMKGLILTAKHHDGFCLWPSTYTEHSVKNSPWKGGHGDVVAELAAACREYGLKFGVYLSPWDRNRADYGTPSYVAYYRNQLRELLSHYGPLFEVWFDGANGGDGYYGGARERRTIDGATYYDWSTTWSVVRALQPHAVMFSDAGPDVRWVGNERGVAFETSWDPIDMSGVYPGDPHYPAVAAGRPDGTHWVPPEVDVSIRPGWFYHQAEDAKVTSVDDLVRIYEQSVGRGANLLLNVPPDRHGLIADADAARLREFGRRIADTYAHDLARTASARASSVRAGSAT
ncbi:MAG TPA: alpha-L-fucosidase, partial [Vicinamibacterales bacterium]